MRYGLIGEKLGHSFSKIIHEQLADYTYEIIELKKEEVKDFITSKEYNALNVTIPYKQTVMPYLDVIDDVALEINAVNTIVNINGKLHGYNTDYYGFKYMCEFNNIEISNKKVLIIGNGGAAQAIKAVVKHLKCKEFKVLDIVKTEETILIDEIDCCLDYEIIINTSPIGMYPNINAIPIDLVLFTNLYAVLDAVYNPLKTKLCLAASERNIINLTGLEMLIAQAKYAVEYFKNISIEDSCINNIYLDLIKDKTNICLTGMPSSGKTYVSKILSDKMNREIIDIDEEIVKKSNMTIPQIFEKYGEQYFRDLESEVIEEVSKKENIIISTGGGSILRKDNITNLMMNSRIYFLDRDLDLLITNDSNRPLSKGKDAVENLYNSRIDIYKSTCDKQIDSNQSLEKVCEDIMEDFYEHFSN